MSDSNKPLPPVPEPIVVTSAPAVPAVIAAKLPTTGKRVAALPSTAAPVRSIFDVAPPATSAARKQADDLRRSLSGSLQGMRNTSKLVESASAAIAADADTAAIFAHEGLTPELLKQFTDLTTPLLKAFTAAT